MYAWRHTENCFVWQDCETVSGEPDREDKKAKFFFKATLQILNLNRKIFIASVEQSGSTRSKYIFLHVTFLSSYKTNRLHFAERLFSYKKRNKTKIVTKASVTMTWSLAVRVRIFLSCLDKQSLIDKSGNILFLLHLHTIGKKLIPSRGCGCESAHMCCSVIIFLFQIFFSQPLHCYSKRFFKLDKGSSEERHKPSTETGEKCSIFAEILVTLLVAIRLLFNVGKV